MKETPTRSASERGPTGPRRTKGSYMAALIGIVVVAVLVSGVLLVGCGDDEEVALTRVQAPVAVGSANTITVIGKGMVTSAPDEAVVTLSVENDAAEPGLALDANSQKITAVIDRLKQEGVTDDSIETANVSVYAIRNWDPETGKEGLTGYRAQNTVTVTLKDAEVVGKVLAASVETGATNISGPMWRLAEDSAAITEALKEAVTNAKNKAEALAAAQGVKVGEAIMMNEGGVDQPDVYYARAYTDMAAAGESKVAEPPISPANLDITATVTITYILVR